MKSSRIAVILFFLVVLFFSFYRLDLVSIGNGSEFRAEIAREMLQAGNYFVPLLNGTVKLSKPPLYYDWIILFYKLAGQTSLLVARVSSIVVSLVILAMGFGYASRTLRLARPLAALALLFFTPIYLYSTRRAELDILLTLEIWLLFVSTQWALRRQDRLIGALPYVLVACIFFTKGPLILLFAFFWTVLYVLQNGLPSWVALVRRLVNPLGVLLLGLIFMFFYGKLIAFKSLYLQTGISEVALRFPLTTYLDHPAVFLKNMILINPRDFLLFAFPLSVLALLSLGRCDDKLRSLQGMAWGVILSIFTFNEVTSTYYLPALPFLALIVAARFEQPAPWLHRVAMGMGGAVLAVVILASVLLYKVYGGIMLVVIVLAIMAAGMRLFTRKASEWWLVVPLAILYFFVIQWVEPLDLSNEIARYGHDIRQEFLLKDGSKPVYSLNNVLTAFSFNLQQTVREVSAEDLEKTLKVHGQLGLLVDSPEELSLVLHQPHVHLNASKLFVSRLLTEVYPKISLIKPEKKYFNFLWLTYKD